MEARIIDVPSNGACFYYSLYRSLKAERLLEQFCSIYAFALSEDQFIKDIKRYLIALPSLREKYVHFFDSICSNIQRRNTDAVKNVAYDKSMYLMFLKAITEPLPSSLLRLLMKHIDYNADPAEQSEPGGDLRKAFTRRKYTKEQRQAACKNFLPFYKDIIEALPKNGYWATQMETDSIQEMLHIVGITMSVIAKESPLLERKKSGTLADVQHIAHRPNTIYLFNNFYHYQYFVFQAQAQIKTPVQFKKPVQVITIQSDDQDTQQLRKKQVKRTVNNRVPCAAKTSRGLPCKNLTDDPPYCSIHKLIFH